MKLLLFPLALIYALPFYFVMPSWMMFAWFVAGLLLGIILLMADELFFYKYYEAKTSTSLQLITRSPLFVVIYPVLAIFAITSSGNVVGIGLILGIGLTLVYEAWLLRKNTVVLKQRFLQHLSGSVAEADVPMLVTVGTLIFIALSLITFIQ